MALNRHPSEYFIKYLLTLTRPEAQDDTWIQYSVQSMGFPPPADIYIQQLRSEVEKDLPLSYDPNDRYNRASVKFLRTNGVWSMHNPDDAVRECLKILPNYRARRIIEQLLLGRIEDKEVAKKANSRLGEYYKTAVIKAYRHYFWNTSLLKTSDWMFFFEEYEATEAASSIAVLQGGPATALHITGFQQNLECKEMLKEMMEGLYFDFREWKVQPRSLAKTRAMTNIAKAATQIDVRMSEADSALRDSLKAFEAFRMEHAQKGVKSIDDIAPAGNFTESGVDIKELPAPKKEAKKG
jgi:hypothetical protein